MRILFTVTPVPTLFLPMVPLAWALRAAGHEVRIASQPTFTGDITGAGLTAVPVGRVYDMYRLMMLTEMESRPGLQPPLDVVTDPGSASWDTMIGPYTEAVRGEHNYENFPMINGLVDFARQWQPDLILWEPSTYAGAIAAKVCGAAHARLVGRLDALGVAREHFLRLRNLRAPSDRSDPMADWLDGYARKYGAEFSEDMVTGHFTVDQLPTSLQARAGLEYHPMRFVPYGGAAEVEKWLWAPPERPRVALTLGLALDEFSEYIVDIADVLEALADLDVEVIATIDERERDKIRTVPDHVRLVNYVPLHALAPTCAAVINHAGAGTLLTTALHGVPQLTVPWHEDEPELARRLAEQGAGMSILADEVSADGIRSAVRRLLTEPAFAQRAGDLRAELLAMPTPAQLVPQLEELTTKHRP